MLVSDLLYASGFMQYLPFCDWHISLSRGFSGGSDGKASAYNAGDLGLIPGSGRSSGEELATHSSTLAWKIPWTEECRRL